jgi:hypothetical protein
MENLLVVYLNGILVLRMEELRTIRRKAQGTWGKTCLEPYAISLVPLFIKNVSAPNIMGCKS